MILREYQKPAFNAINKAIVEEKPKASVYAATGAGKTVLFQAMIQQIFNADRSAKVLVVHPRIALSTDQQVRFSSIFKCGFTSFHSGSVVQNTTSQDEINVYNKSTTSPEKLSEIVFEEQKAQNHIVFTSYNSVSKIVEMGFDYVIFDEAHYLAQKEFGKILDLNITAKQYFFTATPIQGVMDNEELFGSVIAEIAPKELISLGYLVQPRMFYTQVKTDQRGDVMDYSTAIAATFNEQASHLDARLTPKMMVSMSDTSQFESVMNIDSIRKMRNVVGEDLDVYYITASKNVRNGTNISSRSEALKQFAESERPSIILQCDTLAEGIDIDGLTGVFVCRGLKQEKFIQTVGRSVRPYKADIVDGTPVEFDSRAKKYGLVSVAVVDGDMKVDSRVANWFQALINAGFGNIGEIANLDSYDGKLDVDQDGTLVSKAQSKILDIEFQEQMALIDEMLAAA